MQQAHILISGFVHGVGYRQFAKKEANKRGVFGWVKNIPQGKVEMILQGEKEKIEELIKTFKIGPFMSEVKDIEITWEEMDVPFTEFFIDA
ncbi:acylphosphatase [soil metagenome]